MLLPLTFELGHHRPGLGATYQSLVPVLKLCHLLPAQLPSTSGKVSLLSHFGPLKCSEISVLLPLLMACTDGTTPHQHRARGNVDAFDRAASASYFRGSFTTAPWALLLEDLAMATKATFCSLCVNHSTNDGASATGMVQHMIEAGKVRLATGGDGSRPPDSEFDLHGLIALIMSKEKVSPQLGPLSLRTLTVFAHYGCWRRDVGDPTFPYRNSGPSFCQV